MMYIMLFHQLYHIHSEARRATCLQYIHLHCLQMHLAHKVLPNSFHHQQQINCHCNCDH